MNALPQDPFEDMEDMDWQGNEDPGQEMSKPQATASGKSTAAKKKSAKGRKKTKKKTTTGQKVKKEVSGQTSPATVVGKKTSAEATSITETTAEDQVKIKASNDLDRPQDTGRTADPIPPVSRDYETGWPGHGDAQIVDGTTPPGKVESEPNDLTIPDHMDPEVVFHEDRHEQLSAREDVVPDQVTEEDSDGQRPLYELITIIDDEIDEVFGPGAMTDLDQDDSMAGIEAEQHVIFSLADTEFAVSISHVTEIGRPLAVTHVPNVPSWLIGVANLRGEIISMVDMRAFLGVEKMSFDRNRRMIVGEAIREDLRVGFIVDRVANISHLEKARISEPTARIDDQISQYLRGVYEQEGQLLVLLDLDRLLLSAEMRQFEPM